MRGVGRGLRPVSPEFPSPFLSPSPSPLPSAGRKGGSRQPAATLCCPEVSPPASPARPPSGIRQGTCGACCCQHGHEPSARRALVTVVAASSLHVRSSVGALLAPRVLEQRLLAVPGAAPGSARAVGSLAPSWPRCVPGRSPAPGGWGQAMRARGPERPVRPELWPQLVATRALQPCVCPSPPPGVQGARCMLPWPPSTSVREAPAAPCHCQQPGRAACAGLCPRSGGAGTPLYHRGSRGAWGQALLPTLLPACLLLSRW